MKKTAVFILILLLLVSALHADVNGETLRLSATVKNVVYIGVTRKAITSSIVPETINNIAFSFNPNTGKWESNEAYIYVISFVPYALEVKLSSNSTGLERITGDSEPSTLNYSGSVTAMNNSSATMTTSSITFSEGTKTTDETLYKESLTEGVTGFTDPRVRSWKFSVVIDPSKYTNPYIPSGNEYQETFTLSISTVS